MMTQNLEGLLPLKTLSQYLNFHALTNLSDHSALVVIAMAITLVAYVLQKTVHTLFGSKGGKTEPNTECQHNDILDYYRSQIVGRDEVFEGPYGPRRILYCDWTASGKALKCVEKYIEDEILSLYANTHTETSVTGIQMTHFREEARRIILDSVHGRESHDVVFFCGTGATGAIAKMAGILYRSSSFDRQSTVVFIGPYEHNSNILMWTEMGIHVEVIPESDAGGIDQGILVEKLNEFENFKLRIGSFSAASNISGIHEDTANVTRILHEHGALSFWDFASGAPYMNIQMTCRTCIAKEKQKKTKQTHTCACSCFDAVFISPHKFMAGPQTPGLLIAKKHTIRNDIPVIPGGGTVFYAFGTVPQEDYEYKDDFAEREEGGTQDIVGSMRAALAFAAKDAVGTDRIDWIERRYVEMALKAWDGNENIRIMGHTTVDRVATFSFYIVNEWNGIRKTLHHNFVAALMNDLFGIQGRGGCSCAGLYGKQLLQLEKPQLDQFVAALHQGNELSKPGFMRINFHYTMTEEEVMYVIEVVLFLAEHGWRFVPMYRPIYGTSEWVHINLPDHAYHRRSLESVRFGPGGMEYPKFHRTEQNEHVYQSYLDEARDYVRNGLNYPQICTDCNVPRDEKVAWYWSPREIMGRINPEQYPCCFDKERELLRPSSSHSDFKTL